LNDIPELNNCATPSVRHNAQNGLPESLSEGGLNLARTFNGYGELDGQAFTGTSGTPLKL